MSLIGKLPGFLTGKVGIAAALVLGISAGGLGAALSVKTELPANATPDPAKFSVDPSNTPGFPKVKGGDFDLVDHNGNRRTSKNPEGKFQLLFFGYSNCKAICSMALPAIAEAVDLMEEMNAPITPILITVDPKRDTVEGLRKSVGDIHAKMVGLTGTEENLGVAYKAFNLEKKFLFEHVEEGAVYSHGSFIYLLDAEGNFKTLFAPVISPVRIAEISAGYIAEGAKSATN